jgi:hypothetical protein
VTPLVDDVARQSPEPKWQLRSEKQQRADLDNDDADDQKYFPKVADWVSSVHRDPHLKSVEAGSGGVRARETRSFLMQFFVPSNSDFDLSPCLGDRTFEDRGL